MLTSIIKKPICQAWTYLLEQEQSQYLLKKLFSPSIKSSVIPVCAATPAAATEPATAANSTAGGMAPNCRSISWNRLPDLKLLSPKYSKWNTC